MGPQPPPCRADRVSLFCSTSALPPFLGELERAACRPDFRRSIDEH